MSREQFLRTQFTEAKQKYHRLVRHDSFHYTIIHDGSDLEFSINLPKDYPYSPPVVLARGYQIKLPIIDNWCRGFLLVNIIDQLAIYVSVEQPEQLKVDKREVESAVNRVSLQSLTDNKVRQGIIDKLSVVKQAREQACRLTEERNKLEYIIDQSKEDLKNSLFQIEEMCAKREELHTQLKVLRDPVSAEMEAKRNKINQLYQEYARIQTTITSIQQRFANRELTPEQYMKEVLKARQQQLFNEILAQELEAEIPR